MILTLGAGISLASNFLLIPMSGFVGAAQTSILVHVVLGVLLLLQGLRAMPVRVSSNDLARWILFSLILALSLAALRPFLLSEIATVIALAAITLWMVFWGYALRLHSTLR